MANQQNIEQVEWQKAGMGIGYSFLVLWLCPVRW